MGQTKIIQIIGDTACGTLAALVMSGTITVVVGGLSIAAMKVGVLVQPYKQQIKTTIVMGAEISVTSFALLSFGVGVAGMLDERAVQRAIAEVDKNTESFTPSVCVGCRYFHGLHYGGEKLNCAIHPAGPTGSSCGDWEEFNLKDLESLNRFTRE